MLWWEWDGVDGMDGGNCELLYEITATSFHFDFPAVLLILARLLPSRYESKNYHCIGIPDIGNRPISTG